MKLKIQDKILDICCYNNYYDLLNVLLSIHRLVTEHLLPAF